MSAPVRTLVWLTTCGWLASAVAPFAIGGRPVPAVPRTADQDSTRTIWSGVYAAAQAKRGESIAGKTCTPCHGLDLAGGQDGPSLVGPDVLQAWSSLTLGDLFDRIKTTMPADAPRSLSAQDTADVLAYLISVNKCPAGDKELPADQDALNQIRIARQPAPER